MTEEANEPVPITDRWASDEDASDAMVEIISPPNATPPVEPEPHPGDPAEHS